jgi:hypothetical protein
MMHQLLTSLAGVFHKSPDKAIPKRLDRDPQGGFVVLSLLTFVLSDKFYGTFR